MMKRKRILKVDFDILILGIYYLIVIAYYLIFEMLPVNYRPILINGFLEASVFMVIGRLVSGAHWLTDIVGAVLLSAGIFNLYKSVVHGKLEG